MTARPQAWLHQAVDIVDHDGTPARATVVTARTRGTHGVQLVVKTDRGALRILNVDQPEPPPIGTRLACSITVTPADSPANARALARAVLEGRASGGSVERQISALAVAILEHVPEPEPEPAQ